MLEIMMLGPLEVRRDGRPVAIPGGKTAELLVHLALAAGAPVRADRLVDDLWGGSPTNRNTLQQKVTRLRRSLGDPALVAGLDGAYALAADRESIDAHRVAGDLEAAATLLAEGDHAGAVARSDAALARFRGDLLPAAGDWAAADRTRLEEARLRLLETRLAGRLRLGEDVVGELESAVAATPHREELWELLITALYRAGRQAEALAAYRRVRALLGDELALEPGPRLKELERRVLSQDRGLALPAGNLPALAVDLVGREVEVAVLRDLLARHR